MRPIFEINDRVQVQNPKLKTHEQFGTVVTDGNAPHNLPANTQGYIFGVKLDFAKTTRFFKESNLNFVNNVDLEPRKLTPIAEHPLYKQIMSENGGDLSDYEYHDVDFSYVDFTGPSSNDVDCSVFHGCNLEGSILTDCSSVRFHSCNLKNSFIRQAYEAEFYDCDMRGIEFGYEDHEDVEFHRCDMRGAKMAGDFEDGSFYKCKMKGMRPSDTKPTENDYYPKLRTWGVTIERQVNEDFQTLHEIGNLNDHCYKVIFLGDHIQIGCKGFSRSEWENFKHYDIASLDGHCATEWWNDNKDDLFKAHDQYLKELAEFDAE